MNTPNVLGESLYFLILRYYRRDLLCLLLTKNANYEKVYHHHSSQYEFYFLQG